MNIEAVADDCSIPISVAQSWLSVLEASYTAFRLPAFYKNIRKQIKKRPKIHFYDTGLVCWLLGIKNFEDLKTHYCRGPLFETWVVSEAAKERANRRRFGRMWFYRDKNSECEADLVLEASQQNCTLIEAKSTMTALSNILGTTPQVSQQLKEAGCQSSTIIVYAGTQNQNRETHRLVPWENLQNLDWDAIEGYSSAKQKKG